MAGTIIVLVISGILVAYALLGNKDKCAISDEEWKEARKRGKEKRGGDTEKRTRKNDDLHISTN